MTQARLPGGDKAWFVRRGTRWNCQVTPASPAGWVLIAFYTAVAVAISLFFLAEEEEAALTDWIAWGVLLTAATILFLVTVFRMSARAPEPKGKK